MIWEKPEYTDIIICQQRLLLFFVVISSIYIYNINVVISLGVKSLGTISVTTYMIICIKKCVLKCVWVSLELLKMRFDLRNTQIYNCSLRKTKI